MAGLATIYLQYGRLIECRDLLKEAGLSACHIYGDESVDASTWSEHPYIADVLHISAENLRIPGHPEDAEASLQNALTLIKDKLGYDSIHFAKVILDIGDCLQHQEKYNLSIKAMKQAIGLAKDQMGPNSLQFPFSSNHPWVISLGGYPEDDKSQFSYSTEDQSTDISRPMTSEIIGTLDDNNDNELTLKLTSNKSSIDDLTVNKALEELNIDDTEYNSLNSIEYDDDNSFDTGSSDEFSNSSIETKIDKELKDVNRYRRSSRINSTVANQMNIPIPVALTLDLTTQTSPQVVAPVLTPEEKAYSYLLDSLTIRQDIFPDLPNHPAIAESLFGIAENLRLRGYYEDINNKVIDLDVKDDLNDYNTDKLIDNSNDTLVKGSVGWDNETTNQTNKHSTKPNKKPLSKSDLTMALPVYEMSLHIRLSIYPKDHPLVMECEKGIADCLYMLGRLKPAHSLYVNVLIICYRVYGEEHVDTISAMISVTDILKSMGKLYPPDKQSDKPADRQSESKSEKQGDKQVEKPVDKSSPNLGSVSLIDHLSSAFSANVELTSVNNVWSPEVSNQISTVSPTNKKGQVLHPVLSTKKTTAAKDNVKTIGKLPNLANTNVNPNQRGYMGYAFPKTNPVFPTNTNSNKDVNNSNKIQYDSTKWLCDKMLSTYKKIYPNNDVTLLIVQIYYIKGEIAKAKKKPQFALNFYEKALTFSKQLFANKSDNMLINGLLYNAIGELSRNEHNYTNALTYYEKALVIFKNLYKNCPNHPNLSDVTSNIAMLFYSQGKYMEALPLFESSLEKRRIVFGTYHSSVAQSLNNYAGLLHTLGKYHEALPMYEESLAIKSKLFGQNHTDVASSMNNLGLLLKALGKYTEALSYYNQALLIQRKLYGSNHPHIASTLNNKASLLISMQQQLQAKDLYIEVIEMKRKIYGNDDPSVASSLNNLAGLLFNLNDIDRSMVLYEESLRIRKKYFTENHISVAESMNNIGLVLFSLGKLNEAFDYYENALRIKIKLMGERHPSVATSMHNLGGLLHKMKRYDEAKDWYSKAYDIRKFSLGENHMDTKASFENLKAIELDKIKQDKEISNKNNITLLLNTNTSNQIDSKLSGDKLISPGSSRDGEAMFSMNVSNSFDSGLPKY
eukprot:gene18323-24013_t